MLKITYHIGYTIGDFLIIESLLFNFLEFLLTKFCNKDGNVYLNICSQIYRILKKRQNGTLLEYRKVIIR